MTTVAVKGKMMASDTQMDDDGLISNIKKIYNVGGNLIGFAGDVDEGLKFVAWYAQQDEDEEIELHETSAIVLTKEGKILTYASHIPIEIIDKCYAIGSGASMALVAMDHGHNPIEAIKIASMRDAYTGSNVDYKEIE
ncbi:MAG: hypothetical protein OQK75_11890 [Gammaproteobacteria bacterium]|nr:hypothetical protein [Gammaproteobacteria bacterium]